MTTVSTRRGIPRQSASKRSQVADLDWVELSDGGELVEQRIRAWSWCPIIGTSAWLSVAASAYSGLWPTPSSMLTSLDKGRNV